MLPVLARLRSIGFHGLTNVNIRSNYSIWAKCSRNLGWCLSSLTRSTSWTLSLTGVPIGIWDEVKDNNRARPPSLEEGEAEDCVRLVRS
jgi:hypothetical protein